MPAKKPAAKKQEGKGAKRGPQKAPPCTMCKASWELLEVLCDGENRKPLWSPAPAAVGKQRGQYRYSLEKKRRNTCTPTFLSPMESILMALLLSTGSGTDSNSKTVSLEATNTGSSAPVRRESERWDVSFCIKLARSMIMPQEITTAAGVDLKLGVPATTNCLLTRGGRGEDKGKRWYHEFGDILNHRFWNDEPLVEYFGAEREPGSAGFPFEYHTANAPFTWSFLGFMGVLLPAKLFDGFEETAYCGYLMGAIFGAQHDVFGISLQGWGGKRGAAIDEKVLPRCLLEASCKVSCPKFLRKVDPLCALKTWEEGFSFSSELEELCSEEDRFSVLLEFHRLFPMVDVEKGWTHEDFEDALHCATYGCNLPAVKVLHEEFHVALDLELLCWALRMRSERGKPLREYALTHCGEKDTQSTMQIVCSAVHGGVTLCELKRLLALLPSEYLQWDQTLEDDLGMLEEGSNILHALVMMRGEGDEEEEYAAVLEHVTNLICQSLSAAAVNDLFEAVRMQDAYGQTDFDKTPLGRAILRGSLVAVRRFLQMGCAVQSDTFIQCCIESSSYHFRERWYPMLRFGLEELHFVPTLSHLEQSLCDLDLFAPIYQALSTAGTVVNLTDRVPLEEQSGSNKKGRGKGRTWIQQILVSTQMIPDCEAKAIVGYCFEKIGVEGFHVSDIPKGTANAVRQCVDECLAGQQNKEKKVQGGSLGLSTGQKSARRRGSEDGEEPVGVEEDDAQPKGKKQRTEPAKATRRKAKK